MLPNLVRFNDLKARGIVRNRASLKDLIEKHGFPRGRRVLGPNTVTWTEEEIIAYLENAPDHPPVLHGYAKKVAKREREPA